MEEVQQLQEIFNASVQTRARDDGEAAGGSVDVFSWLAQANTLLPAWWSRTRDRQLRAFWRQSDVLSSALYTLGVKISAIPFHVEPRDVSVLQHLREAERYTENLLHLMDFGAGWTQGLARPLEDLFSQDNGCFLEVIGDGPRDGPLLGPALGLASLDASRCTRTRSPEFPVIYTDWGGLRYKLHYTRVIPLVQMPSTAYEMNGVGFCAVSRCVQAAQNLWDIATYKMEKLGSRPKRQILIGEKGLSTNDILTAMRLADQQLDAQGLSRYSRNVILAPKLATANTEIRLGIVDLASAPDGFDEQSSVTLGIYLLAWGFGVDAREFWPAVTSGATKGDALVQHMKSRGKAIGNTLGLLKEKLDRHFLPPYLQLIFDLQDNEEDLVRSQVQLTRSQGRRLDHETQLVSDRVMRQQMLHDGDLTQTQFEELELNDGRLPSSGESVLSLLYGEDSFLQPLLQLPGVPDPLAVGLTWEQLQPKVQAKEVEALRLQALPATARNLSRRVAAQQALAVWDALETRYTAGGMVEPSQPGLAPAGLPVEVGLTRLPAGEGAGLPVQQAGTEGRAKPRTAKEQMQGEAAVQAKERKSGELLLQLASQLALLEKEAAPTIVVEPPDFGPLLGAIQELAKSRPVVQVAVPAPVVNLPAPVVNVLASASQGLSPELLLAAVQTLTKAVQLGSRPKHVVRDAQTGLITDLVPEE